MEYLAKELPSQILTPLLFSIGSSPEEIRKGEIASPLEEIVNLASCQSSGRLITESIYDLIRLKGYDI